MPTRGGIVVKMVRSWGFQRGSPAKEDGLTELWQVNENIRPCGTLYNYRREIPMILPETPLHVDPEREMSGVPLLTLSGENKELLFE